MAQVYLRLFGLGKGAASKAHLTQAIGPGTTVSTLAGWETQVADNDSVSFMPKAFGG
jgi:hypothetical protein